MRENILMTPTVLRLMKRCDLRGIVLFLNWLALNINMLLPFIFLPMTLYLFVSSGDIAFSCALLLGSSLVWSVIPGLIYCRKKRSIFQLVWAFGFGFYTLFLLSWISIYAVFTVRNSKWLTRERKKQTLCS